MATLRHAVLARAVGLTQTDFRIKSLMDIVTEDTVGVPSFPHNIVTNVAFWCKGIPNEALTFAYGADGPEGSNFASGEISGNLWSNGEMEAAGQVPISLHRAGTYSVWIRFGKHEVWRRSFSAMPIPKPTIQ